MIQDRPNAQGGKVALYRHYDKAGNLLYVGITSRVEKRTKAHIEGSSWALDIATIEIEWIDSRKAAEHREKSAIKVAKPAFNKVHATERDMTELTSVEAIVHSLGKDRILRAFGVKARLMQLYIKKDIFPAAWFDGLEKMTGQALPRNLFTFKEVAK
ncbi:MAG: GIY-YIG nuclease family protein [Rhodobacteraceae bacterium]|jgi:predicted GIY-YIG superfamily endonuclease|nr:GIY-YIG nuclease family protein [Paracoccaceae bacterium]